MCGCPLIGTLADAFAYASAAGVTLRIDGTEVQVRRPRANKPGRRAFVSGKKKMNTKKRRPSSPTRRAAPCGPARSDLGGLITLTDLLAFSHELRGRRKELLDEMTQDGQQAGADTFLRLAEAGSFEPKWSAEVLDELRRNLIRNTGLSEA
nr:hypothetical protein [Phenylobacterium sp.]